ncbi:hypothetical protein [Ramlibacter pallidus]|uniref:Transposase IS66 zinc-finger binding domain-containing protein n=1 Tax=Ramlibacter pallidus TaxID=2780087 RepID=A0ABR9S0F1_9BURK|nr:hypothetical protein [Ramlibacter pallidus]MBE7366512.1 hypothetical protein [Ramlibacter pallidus]
MASYFVTSSAQSDGRHTVHDRDRCPPSRFALGGMEYLGEFGDAQQAVVVARVRYAHARGCPCCDPRAPLAPLAPRHATQA